MMPEIPNWLASLFSGATLLALSIFWNGARAKDKARDDKVEAISNKVTTLELQMVKDLASREDVEKLAERLDGLDKTLSQVRDMVIRLDERGKFHDSRE